MIELENGPWGPSRFVKSFGLTNIVLVNALFAFVFLVFSVMHSFWGLPFFADDVGRSQRAMVLSTLILLRLFDLVAIWRFIKLHNRWLKVKANKLLLWGLQLSFVGAVGYANFWMLTVVWFWWGK